MIIQEPSIWTNRKGLHEHRNTIMDFVNKYNESKSLKDHLREPHIRLYMLMVEVSARQMEFDRAALDTSKWYPIQGAPSPYAKTLNCSTRAISGRLARLIEAGIVSVNPNQFEIELGRPRIITNKVREILINPLFLHICETKGMPLTPGLNCRNHDEMPTEDESEYELVGSGLHYIEFEKHYTDFIIDKTSK